MIYAAFLFWDSDELLEAVKMILKGEKYFPAHQQVLPLRQRKGTGKGSEHPGKSSTQTR